MTVNSFNTCARDPPPAHSGLNYTVIRSQVQVRSIVSVCEVCLCAVSQPHRRVGRDLVKPRLALFTPGFSSLEYESLVTKDLLVNSEGPRARLDQ